MDFMKVFDQTVREIKREVNLKILKIPEIEQKVLDATDDEPWGPHGTALAEIAQATKKFSECQMVMNVLWTRLTETGKNWRFVYKALAVIEYLVSHGSERAVDDIIEHTFQISSLASFEYVEPSGKDLGINVRKKAENIVLLLNDKDKIEKVRDKAASNRDKYFGLSSSGVTYKSGSASFSSSSSQPSGGYGGFGSQKDDDDFKVRDSYGDDKFDQATSVKSRRGSSSKLGNASRNGSSRYGSKGQEPRSSKKLTKIDGPDQPIPPENSSTSTNNYDDDFDDFDPRGTSSAKPPSGTFNQVDLFGQNLIGDLLDVPTAVAAEKPATQNESSEVDLFADAAFVSATSLSEAGGTSDAKKNVDLFASQPAPLQKNADPFASQPAPSQKDGDIFASQPAPASVDFFAAPGHVAQSDNTTTSSDQKTTSPIDPFAAVPLNNFDGSDPFGAFAQNPTNGSFVETKHSSDNLNGSSVETKHPPKKDAFQVKSGIWADSLSRGLIDLNITAPKKVNLADVGVVGSLSDPFDEKNKGPSTSFYMGSTMGSGSAVGNPGYNSAASGVDDFFSSLSNQQYQYQYGGYKK